MKNGIEKYQPQELTLMIGNAFKGDNNAMDDLIQVIYPDLKMIASGLRHKQMQVSQTLNTTSLVNEAWLKLNKYGIKAESRKHFFCLVARAMRHILIDASRSKLRNKRKHLAVNIDNIQIESENDASWFIQLNEIVKSINKSHPRIAQVFELKYFLGLTFDEIAVELNFSSRTVKRDWMIAKQTIKKII
jgi:RNA polymerase sigma factor (TIGR02999 family)